MLSKTGNTWHASKRPLYGLIYGITIGFTYSLAIWLPDAVILTPMHVPYLWLRLGIGALLLMCIGGAAGMIAGKVNRSLATVILWLATSAAFAWITTHLPYEWMPQIIVRIAPQYIGWIPTEISPAMYALTGVIWFWLGIFFLTAVVVGQIVLLENAIYAAAPAAKLMILLPAFAMIIVGMWVDSFTNRTFRGSMTNMDKIIEFVIENQDKEIDKKTARDMHIAFTVGDYVDLLDGPRTLMLGRYDIVNEHTNLILNLDGTWLECQAISEIPVTCKQYDSPPGY